MCEHACMCMCVYVYDRNMVPECPRVFPQPRRPEETQFKATGAGQAVESKPSGGLQT